ncbi:MAG: hypothetical protein WB542_15345 [Polaromonas sp.]
MAAGLSGIKVSFRKSNWPRQRGMDVLARQIEASIGRDHHFKGKRP